MLVVFGVFSSVFSWLVVLGWFRRVLWIFFCGISGAGIIPIQPHPPTHVPVLTVLVVQCAAVDSTVLPGTFYLKRFSREDFPLSREDFPLSALPFDSAAGSSSMRSISRTLDFRCVRSFVSQSQLGFFDSAAGSSSMRQIS